MTRALLLSLSCAAVLGMAGCAAVPCDDAQGYQQAQSGGELNVPAGLDRPAPDPAFQIPKIAKGDPAKADSSGVCLATPPDIVKPGADPDAA